MYRRELYHHGIMGQKWGIRRFQNPDGTLTNAGRKRYTNSDGSLNKAGNKMIRKEMANIADKHYNDTKFKKSVNKMSDAEDEYWTGYYDDDDESYGYERKYSKKANAYIKEYDKFESELREKFNNVLNMVPNESDRTALKDMNLSELEAYSKKIKKANKWKFEADLIKEGDFPH